MRGRGRRVAVLGALVALAVAVVPPQTEAVLAPAAATGAAAPLRVVFSRSDGGRGALYSIAADGSDLRRLTPDDGKWYSAPTASPDGTRIAFWQWEPPFGDWDGGLYVADGEGANKRLLATSSYLEPAGGTPLWSPDGRVIAYETADPDAPRGSGGLVSTDCWDTSYVEVESGRSEVLFKSTGFAWAPDSRRFVASPYELEECYDERLPRMVVGNLNGGRTRPLAVGSVSDWGRGDRIVYTRSSRIFVVAAAGGMPRQLTRVDSGGPRFSPSGSRIAFWRREARVPPNRSARYELWAINPNGTGLARLSLTRRFQVGSPPRWSPDGRQLLWQSGGSIWVAPAHGRGPVRRLATGSSATWQR